MHARAQAVDPVAQRLHARPCVSQEGHAGFGQRRALFTPFKQPGIEQGFQFLQGFGKRWLADRQFVAGTCQAALACHLEKTQQMPEFDSVIDVQKGALPWWFGLYYCCICSGCVVVPAIFWGGTSIAAVTAAYGFALTARHLLERACSRWRATKTPGARHPPAL